LKKEDIQNKEDYINYILLELYKKVHAVKFGDFFMEVSPSGGIDNFRNLLDELHENKLVAKTSQEGQEVPGLPGYRTVDLRYTISLKGIEYLKDRGLIFSKTQEVMTKVEVETKKEVFVTYSWDSEEHNEKVIAFTNFLRDQGFDAEMDKMYSQKETAADFYKMMHQAMTDYSKVIVVLSGGYKEKAEKFKGGVGNEYGMIIKDIEANPKKYILVSLEPITDNIMPLQFKGRHVVNVSDKSNLNELYAKLQDEDVIEFSEVGKSKPTIAKKAIPQFQFQNDNLEIGGIISDVDNASQFASLYTSIQFNLNLEVVNNTNQAFSDYTIEVSYPVHSTDYDVDGRIQGNHKVMTYENNPKLFPGQTRTFKIDNLLIRHNTAKEILDSSLMVKIYSDKGAVEKQYLLSDILKVRTVYGDKQLTLDLFQDKNYR